MVDHDNIIKLNEVFETSKVCLLSSYINPGRFTALFLPVEI
jgi:hypothetical protein